MGFAERVTDFTTRHPKVVTALMIVVTLDIVLLAALPSLWPEALPMLNGVKVDTDPENMLDAHEPVRVLHDEKKHTFALYDMVVVGVVNEKHPEGVFNVATLSRIYQLTEYARTLHGAAIGAADPRAGVVNVDIIAPSTVDNIEQGGLGTVRFEWLMPRPPATEAEALAVRDKALKLPFLNGTLISEDGKALALYLPLTSKDLSYQIYRKLNEYLATYPAEEEYHITGLPVAEDTFGVEMFVQMAISAPLAMVVIFLLLLAFFRRFALILSPMIIAMVSVLCTMGLLVIAGKTIHIMSSMIPIFIMPIAVLDSVHILSEFFDRYQETHDRKKTIKAVMRTLFVPMFYTSLTTTAGFGSLAFTPIPPVQVFGLFIAFGVMLAWVLTILFVPAYVMLLPERTFANFGRTHAKDETPRAPNFMDRLLNWAGAFTLRQGKVVLALSLAAVVAAAYGISLIQINDNPTKWFHAGHPIRVADRVLNDHFGGTYMAYLSLRAERSEEAVQPYAEGLTQRAAAHAAKVAETTPEAGPLLAAMQEAIRARAATAKSADELLAALNAYVDEESAQAEGDARWGWEEFANVLSEEAQRGEVFKQPETLRYIEGLQARMRETGIVGKSNSLADVVKTIHRELFEGDASQFRIPDDARAVAQCLITYESSHRPQDLYHFVTPDYTESVVWSQLTSGDNKDMSRVVEEVNAYIAAHPAPFGIRAEWFGLTYINVVWQEKMVAGMLNSFLGSFLMVFLMMVVLFRSVLWGLLSMIPLTLTIGLIYGVVGLIGKDYDMPIAVLSSLTLGLAVDFAIHFLSRARELVREHGSWRAASPHVFGEPARAIARNVIVVALGFTPLLAAPLVPYQTVGVFLAAILMISGGATMLLLPVLVGYLERYLFRSKA